MFAFVTSSSFNKRTFSESVNVNIVFGLIMFPETGSIVTKGANTSLSSNVLALAPTSIWLPKLSNTSPIFGLIVIDSDPSGSLRKSKVIRISVSPPLRIVPTHE